MGFVYSRTDNGLLVADHQVGGEEIARLLRQYDDDLRLVPSIDQDRQCVLWKVYSYRGPNHPSLFVLAWQTEDGTPLPLSSRLLDEVKKHDRNTAYTFEDEDQKNARLKQAVESQWERNAEASHAYWKPVHGRIPHRGRNVLLGKIRRGER